MLEICGGRARIYDADNTLKHTVDSRDWDLLQLQKSRKCKRFCNAYTTLLLRDYFYNDNASALWKFAFRNLAFSVTFRNNLQPIICGAL